MGSLGLGGVCDTVRRLNYNRVARRYMQLAMADVVTQSGIS